MLFLYTINSLNLRQKCKLFEGAIWNASRSTGGRETAGLGRQKSFVLYWNIPNEIKAKQGDEIVAGRKAKVINLEKQDYGMGNDLLI